MFDSVFLGVAGLSASWDEALRKVLLGNGSSLVLVVDRSLRVVAITQHCLARTGRTTEGTIGNSLGTVCSFETLEGVEFAGQVEAVFKADASDARGQVSCCVLGAPIRRYAYQVLPLQIQRAVEYVLILLEDMTERVHLVQQAHVVQAYLASLVEYTSDFVALIDCDGCIGAWNPAAERITGLLQHNMRTRLISILCSGADDKVWWALLRRVMQDGVAYSAELNIEPRPGVIIPIVWTVVPLRAGSDEIVSLLVIGRTLTACDTYPKHTECSMSNSPR